MKHKQIITRMCGVCVCALINFAVFESRYHATEIDSINSSSIHVSVAFQFFFFTSLLSSLLQSVWFRSNDRAKTRLQLKNRETREMGFRKKRKCRQCEMLFFSQIVWICDAASAMNLNVIFLHYFSRIKITETLAAFRWAVFPVLLPIVLFLIPLTAFSWISVLRVRLLLLFSMSYT